MRSIAQAPICFRAGFIAMLILIQLAAIRTLAQTQPANAQIPPANPNGAFDLDRGRLPIIFLNGLWRFRVGDDLAFADPAFDDSRWQLVPADQSQKQIVSLPLGPASFWYRAKVSVPSHTPPLSLYIPHLDMNYEIFIDGQRIGGIGGLPPHTTSTEVAAAAYRLPVANAEALTHPRVISIAIRCWHFVLSPLEDNALTAKIRLGATSLIQETVTLHNRNVFWLSASDFFLALLNTLAGLAAIGLFLFRRQEKEYLWYGLLTLIFAISHSFVIWEASHSWNWPQDLLIFNLLWQSSSLALMVFLFRLLAGKRDRLFWTAISSILLNVLLALADFVPFMFREEWMWADIRLYNGLSFLFFLPFAAWVIVFVARKALDGMMDARLVLPAVAVVALSNVLSYGLTSAQYLFQWGGVDWVDWFMATSEWPIPFSVQNLAELFLLLSMFAVLLLRFTRTRLHEETYEREREAARSVQQVLVPEAIPAIPGF